MTVLDAELEPRDAYDRAWEVAIKDAQYLADVAYEVCTGPLKTKSQAYTEAFTARMEQFRKTWHCPECGLACPTGRCSHCQGE